MPLDMIRSDPPPWVWFSLVSSQPGAGLAPARAWLSLSLGLALPRPGLGLPWFGPSLGLVYVSLAPARGWFSHSVVCMAWFRLSLALVWLQLGVVYLGLLRSCAWFGPCPGMVCRQRALASISKERRGTRLSAPFYSTKFLICTAFLGQEK